MSATTTPETAGETELNPLGLGAAAIAVSAWGLSGVIAKDIDMGGIAIGAYRFMTYGIVLAAFMALRRTPISMRVMRESMWGGLALGADVAFFFSAVKLTSIANATVIGALQPVVVSVVAARFFGERIGRRDVSLGLVAIIGVGAVVLTGSDDSGRALSGDLLSIGALLSWSAYFVFAKRAKERITSQEYTIGAALWTGAVNFPLAFLFGQDLSWPSANNWLWLLILAFGAGLLGHSMMNWSIQQIPLWISSTFTLLIPVVSAIAAWIWLGEPVTVLQMVSMVVVLMALAGIVTSQTGVTAKPRPLRR